MDIARSDIVKSTAGRDQGKFFFVLGVEEDFLLLADGKTRRLERPKRKKRKHVVFQARVACRTTEKIRSGDRLSNSELRKTLAQLGGDGNPDQEG